MTDGTSQGLFIVVAIVIFGIFLVLAYILFEDTLSPALANMFNEATETASERLESNGTILFRDKNFSKWGGTSNRYYTARGTTIAFLDKTVLYNNQNSMKLDFLTGNDGHLKDDDFVMWFQGNEVGDFLTGDTVTIRFYAKAEGNVDLGVRLGNWFKADPVITSLNEDWQKIELTFTNVLINPPTEKGTGAIVLWTPEPSTVWFSDVEIRAYEVRGEDE